MLTPVEYSERYLNLSVPDPNDATDIATGITVSKYLLGLKEAQTNARVELLRKVQKDLAAGRKQDPDYKIRIFSNTANGREKAEFSNIAAKDNDPLWMLIRYPFAGKGSPDGIQAVLQLAATDGPGQRALISKDRIQSYCDDLLGVDCNGFVGSYIRHEIQSVPWWNLMPTNTTVSPNSLISDIWKTAQGVVRNSASEVDPSETNLLVLVDGNGNVVPGGKPPHGHIMISQPGESMSTGWSDSGLLPVPEGTEVPAITVSESTGAKKTLDGTNGLVTSWYHYIDDPQLKNKGVLLAFRGVNGSRMRVKVKALAN